MRYRFREGGMPSGAGSAPGSVEGIRLSRNLIAHALSKTATSAHYRSPRGRPGDRQPLDAVDELRQQPGRFVDRDDVGYLAAQFVEDDPDLAAGQVGAQAEMGAAAAEAQVRMGIARHVEHPRVGEL